MTWIVCLTWAAVASALTAFVCDHHFGHVLEIWRAIAEKQDQVIELQRDTLSELRAEAEKTAAQMGMLVGAMEAAGILLPSGPRKAQ